jgi:hypothetical protein
LSINANIEGIGVRMDNEVSRLQEVLDRLDDHDKRIGSLERRADVTENDMKYVKDDLREIKDNTKWILRLIIGAIVTALLALVIVKAPVAKASTESTVGEVSRDAR